MADLYKDQRTFIRFFSENADRVKEHAPYLSEMIDDIQQSFTDFRRRSQLDVRQDIEQPMYALEYDLEVHSCRFPLSPMQSTASWIQQLVDGLNGQPSQIYANREAAYEAQRQFYQTSNGMMPGSVKMAPGPRLSKAR